ncbi:glycoside hydrolase family 113 [Sediminitomix flava]|uniref:GTA TIM-barrel-like domain-containing protein n=1 Tax=Sediminitomix flava TaxID=379075 RepID=A0A315ZI71_SEDFL|nr:hypothetical protein [Sediminitomix flava]PWJ44913.1 hypothetical protein BC781_1011302 [Sediminitomix flava]
MRKKHFHLAISILLLIGNTTCSPLSSQSPLPKINGLSLVGIPQSLKSTALKNIKQTHANWVAIIPYAFSSPQEANVTFDHERQWYGETTEGVKQYITSCQNEGLQIMMKPHLWVLGQGWAGDLDFDNEEDWLKWEVAFQKYILHFASLAEELDVPLFCIGTECRVSVKTRPQFWTNLIAEVRRHYSGKITYASNWDNYEHVTFWDQLDFIGIDAYFPICNLKTPSKLTLYNGWNEVKNELNRFSEEWNRPILFTEFGFQNMDYTADGHWKHDTDTLSINEKGQELALQSTFDCFWEENWFAGGFLWKWFPSATDRSDRKEFSPQNKAAEVTIQNFYGKY